MTPRARALVDVSWRQVVKLQTENFKPTIDIHMHPEDLMTIRIDRDVQIKGIIHEIDIGKVRLLGFPIVQDASVPIGQPEARLTR